MADITRILSQIEQGNPRAAEELLPLVYDELRRLAAAKLAHEKPGQTLQATALVHEAYMRLAGGQGARSQEPVANADTSGDNKLAPGPGPLVPAGFSSRSHFFAAAAEAMRKILVDCARRKSALKRGGAALRVDFDKAPADQFAITRPDELLAVHDALDALAAEDSLAADLVKLHYFGGFAFEEAAELLGMSRATAYRTWTYARTWLRAALQDAG